MNKENRGWEEQTENVIKEISGNITSVDSHIINVIGPEGTVAQQIVRQKLVPFIKELLTQQREEMVKAVNNFDDKEHHTCRFNDGENDCDCFIEGLEAAKQVIKQV